MISLYFLTMGAFLKYRWFILFFTLLLTTLSLAGEELDFSLYKKESSTPDNTLLIIGGIQGDEPGGFVAASLIATRYTITKGAVWVVPNLAFESIIARMRGINGDMNRKFAEIPEDDPDYGTIQRIKKIITDPHIDLVLNLHDGSGFYRDEYVDNLNNPERWGQSCIIDQIRMNHDKYGNLGEIAQTITHNINEKLIDRNHEFRIKNTQTAYGNVEMEKALTYFAINNNKPALANETSKTLPTHLRVYYQLVALEAYMNYMGIGYEKDFELTPDGVHQAIHENLKLWLFDKRIVLDLSEVRKSLNYVPFDKNKKLEYSSSNPLIALKQSGKQVRVYYGNRLMTTLSMQYFDFDKTIDKVEMVIDGKQQSVPIGSIVNVKNSFSVVPQKDIRTNVIGYLKKGVSNESGITIQAKAIMNRFSVDSKAKLYRVEFYKKGKFVGMVLVRF